LKNKHTTQIYQIVDQLTQDPADYEKELKEFEGRKIGMAKWQKMFV
jgi:hypothetical protein